MAKQIILNPVVIIAAGTVSSSCAQVTINQSAADVKTPAFDSVGWEASIGGLKSGSVTFMWHNDYVAGALDATFNPLLGTLVAFEIHPSGTATVGSSVPKYSGTLLVTEYAPIDGAVGDLATTNTTWPTVGPVTRGTA